MLDEHKGSNPEAFETAKTQPCTLVNFNFSKFEFCSTRGIMILDFLSFHGNMRPSRVSPTAAIGRDSSTVVETVEFTSQTSCYSRRSQCNDASVNGPHLLVARCIFVKRQMINDQELGGTTRLRLPCAARRESTTSDLGLELRSLVCVHEQEGPRAL